MLCLNDECSKYLSIKDSAIALFKGVRCCTSVTTIPCARKVITRKKISLFRFHTDRSGKVVTWQIGTEQSPTGIDVKEIYGNSGVPTSRQRKLATIPKKLFLAKQTNKAGTDSNFSGFELF